MSDKYTEPPGAAGQPRRCSTSAAPSLDTISDVTNGHTWKHVGPPSCRITPSDPAIVGGLRTVAVAGLVLFTFLFPWLAIVVAWLCNVEGVTP